MTFIRPRTHSPAFTLIETLVVIVIVAIVSALSLLALQGAREAARRATCMNNLHQFGRAFGSFVSTKGKFPRGGPGHGYSFIVELLPYMEQATLYNSLNLEGGADAYENSPANDVLRKTSLSFLACPSDRSDTNIDPAWTSYAGNLGTGTQVYGYNGAFVRISPNPDMSIFADGTSQTAAVSEWVKGPHNINIRDVRRTVFETNRLLSEPKEFTEFRNLCHNINTKTAQPSVILKGEEWMLAEFGNTFYNHILGINDHSCLNKTAVQTGAFSAGSEHASGGANVLFVDGHVQWVKESVALPVWQALGSRAGGEVVDPLSY